ncbi:MULTISPECIES: hypothetical protein [Bacillaceae]|jgi:hypothetical protein|uniref:Uncharacterized protein n=1 Tax=Gottfriedia luciferensis TaxID=178774 RepID=A0ABX2ZLE9_9BACI|nr:MULTISPECIES: hypothetical protein [Bacillaceae]PET71783.1 hypothetical protein CN514_05890 [Bacillus sp. AFS001701]ODG90169.1 hypothetical protein BED47_12595 [Gottfriedia luciferensis]PEC48452.1 hypothetical protein CON00_16235 [Bacillus sp. AFS096315]PFM81119.1 hypothetical protein COJ46_09335 [Bacillus sp. AFS077874]PGM57815.1 hypothetical protein CN946_06650 [Bacillus sp. AFS053548]
MNFTDYLINVKKLNEVKASQYNHRLSTLKKYRIYNNEKVLSVHMLKRIKSLSKDTTKQYLRTINYHIEFLNDNYRM